MVEGQGRYETLPRGRHGLSREQVTSSQRTRLLLGMAETVAERGYVKTTVTDVLKRVRVSRETFYQHFADKEACFRAVLDEAAALLAGRLPIDATEVPDESLPQRAERILLAYFGVLAGYEQFARVFFLESFAAGEPAQRTRMAVQERFAELMSAAFEPFPEWRSLPDAHLAARVFVGGISSLAMAALVSGDVAGLIDDVPQLVELLRRLLAPPG